jgi:transcriptional regulator with AAA-type ATPase domain
MTQSATMLGISAAIRAVEEEILFGHVKGSFTDVHRDKGGWLEAAHGSWTRLVR